VYRPRYHLIITLIISQQTWLTWYSVKWPLARNPDRSWWHRHTSPKVFLTAAHGLMENRPWVTTAVILSFSKNSNMLTHGKLLFMVLIELLARVFTTSEAT
jgi:hypothetical protein